MQDADDERRSDDEIGVVEDLDEEIQLGKNDPEEVGPHEGGEAINDDNMDTTDPDVQGEAGDNDGMDAVGCNGDKGGGAVGKRAEAVLGKIA